VKKGAGSSDQQDELNGGAGLIAAHMAGTSKTHCGVANRDVKIRVHAGVISRVREEVYFPLHQYDVHGRSD
jgi:hypothetical protein